MAKEKKPANSMNTLIRKEMGVTENVEIGISEPNLELLNTVLESHPKQQVMEAINEAIARTLTDIQEGTADDEE